MTPRYAFHTTAQAAFPALVLAEVSPRKNGPSVSLSVGEGECIALLTLSGDGEDLRLLSDTLTGFHPAAKGTVTVAGQDVTARAPGRRGLAVAGPRDGLFDHLTVRENVAFPLKARRVPAADVVRLTGEKLALLGLEAVADQKPAGLSDGLRVRTALARALATDPACLILEDVFSGLGSETRRDLHQRLARLRRARGVSLLLLTRDRQDALAAASRIGVMADGALLQLDTAAMLTERPASARVAEVMGDACVLVGITLAVEDDIARVRLACGGEMEAVADPDLMPGDLTDLCIRPGQIAPMFRRGRPAPEDEEGTLSATLVEILYPGEFIALRFRLADGTEIMVHRPPGSLPPRTAPGQSALLAWNPGSAVAFPSGGKQG